MASGLGWRGLVGGETSSGESYPPDLRVIRQGIRSRRVSCSAVKGASGKSPPDEVDQQVRLWLGEAHEAYVSRRLPRVIHYFQRALAYAEERGLQREIALICRDLGYVYAREGALGEALALLDRGLAAGESAEVAVRVGLLANKASVLTRRRSYHDSLALLEQAASLIDGTYGSLAAVPSWLAHSYAGIRRMAGDLRRVVELLDMGVKPERLEVEIKSQEPPWLPKR